jgi:hypothetical protein
LRGGEKRRRGGKKRRENADVFEKTETGEHATSPKPS